MVQLIFVIVVIFFYYQYKINRNKNYFYLMIINGIILISFFTYGIVGYYQNKTIQITKKIIEKRKINKIILFLDKYKKQFKLSKVDLNREIVNNKIVIVMHGKNQNTKKITKQIEKIIEGIEIEVIFLPYFFDKLGKKAKGLEKLNLMLEIFVSSSLILFDKIFDDLDFERYKDLRELSNRLNKFDRVDIGFLNMNGKGNQKIFEYFGVYSLYLSSETGKFLMIDKNNFKKIVK